MSKPYVIGIAGESGVGKSTIAEIISLFYGVENTTIISTDDLHKWERSNPAWENITHLNPEANNLELGDMHLDYLSKGKFIYRSIYNHHTGAFDPPIKIQPQDVVIIEGLHAFYTELSKKVIDLKIYVDTDEDLKCHWKIIRDTEERGYKYNTVLEAINKRKKDGQIIRSAQIGVSDIIITIKPKQQIKCLGDKHEKIELQVSCQFQNDKSKLPIASFIEEYISEFDIFVRASENIGNDIELCQETGGNISIKLSNDLMFIKASGAKMKNIREENKYCIVHNAELLQAMKLVTDDDSMNQALQKYLALTRYKKPSMETAFHVLLDKYVVHTHPIYTTLLLCLENSENIIKELYSDLKFNYVNYAHPGFFLYNAILQLDKSPIYFLENHGIIITSNNSNECIPLLKMINDRAKNYILAKCKGQVFDLSFANCESEDNYVFPDAIVFSKDISKVEVQAAHNYITIFGNKIDKLRYLSQDNIHYLQNMESEKYRKKA